MKKLRLCLLADAPSIHTRRWVGYFIHRGYEVHLVSFRPHEIEGATLHLVKKKTDLQDLDYLLNLSRVRMIIRKIQPDILNAHYLTSYGYLAARSKFHPFVASAWGSDVLITPRKTPLHRLLTSTVLRSADLITCESEVLASHMVQLGAQKNKILVVPQGIDPAIFYPLAAETKANNLLLSVRDHKPVYNIDTIIRAAKELKSARKEFTLAVAGDGPLRPRLEALAKDLGLSERIRFTGRLTHSDLADLYRKSRLFISIPSSDSTSTALLEAMATGSFPIVSNIPANREWIENNKNGILVPPRDASALARAIEEALENDKLRNEAAETNLRIIQEKALWGKNMSLVENSFLKLVQNQKLNI